MKEVNNLSALRHLEVSTLEKDTLYYVKGHSNGGDGGGGVFMWTSVGGNQDLRIDNNGTLIRPNNDAGIGSNMWVRQYEGFINVRYFGAFGNSIEYTQELQNAIDFAALNSINDAKFKGATIYIPNGNYRINQIMLRSTVTITGESIEGTLLQVTDNHSVDYMFKMGKGPIFLNISNLKIFGRRETNAGCFLFEAKPLDNFPNHGGLWNSSFKNIQISGFKGHGIYLKGGTSGKIPNQFNTFENVRVGKDSDFSNALKMTGQNGQTTFLNCTFDGFNTNAENIFPRGHNVSISRDNTAITATLSFINCTFQEGDYGIYINYAENINIDTCWFESLGVAIRINGEFNICRAITIQNNRFANAAGYGSMHIKNPDINIKKGQCISLTNAFVNVYNNYVEVTEPESINLNDDNLFVLATGNEKGGVSIANNNFRNNKIGRTFGVMQVINVLGNILDSGGNKLVFVNSSSQVIKSIESSINATETIRIRANNGNITFDNTGNIFLTNWQTLELSSGEMATFMKIDNIVGQIKETYQLISVMRSNS